MKYILLTIFNIIITIILYQFYKKRLDNHKSLFISPYGMKYFYFLSAPVSVTASNLIIVLIINLFNIGLKFNLWIVVYPIWITIGIVLYGTILFLFNMILHLVYYNSIVKVTIESLKKIGINMNKDRIGISISIGKEFKVFSNIDLRFYNNIDDMSIIKESVETAIKSKCPKCHPTVFINCFSNNK